MAAARGAELDLAAAAELRAAELRAAELRAAELRAADRRQAQALTDTGPMSRHRFMEAQRDQYPVQLRCQLVAVPASGYYAWQRAQQPPSTGQREPAWETARQDLRGA